MEEQIIEKNEEEAGKIIVFASAKGGVGKTIISVNTAVALAQKGSSTCIIDGDFQFGDVNLALDLQPKLTISDLAQDMKSLESDMVSNYIQRHESGLKVLSSPLRPEHADLISPEAGAAIVKKLSSKYEYVVVDLSSGLLEQNLIFMEAAHKIIIITDLEMAALKNTKTMIKTLTTLNLGDKLSIVVNRGDMESVIKFKDVSKILEAQELFFISNDFKIVSKSFNIGIPFVSSKPNEKISKEINILAHRISNKRYSPRNKKRKRRGIFDIFRGGRT